MEGPSWQPEAPADLPQAPRTWGREQAATLLRQAVEFRQAIVPAAWLAVAMGVSPEVVYRLEAAERDPRLSTILRYCHVLGLTLQIQEEGAAA